MRNLKSTILGALESNDLASVASLAKEDRKVLSQLLRLTYDKETLVGWRAIKATGLAAREMMANDYPFLRETCRKLLWSLSDESGEIGWSSPELLGEIVSADPEKFKDIIPLIAEVYALEETVFRAGVLYALARIGQVDPGLILPFKNLVFKGMTDSDPIARVYALQLAQMLKGLFSREDTSSFQAIASKMDSDAAEVWIYKDGSFANIQVKEAASQLK